MKTIDQLQLYFEKEIKPNFSELEEWRKKNKNTRWSLRLFMQILLTQ